MSTYQIWDSHSAQDLALRCRRQEGLALIIWQNLGSQASFLLRVSEIGECERGVQAVFDHLSRLGYETGRRELQVRLVGHPALMAALAKRFVEHGESVEKKVSRYQDFSAIYYPREHRLRISRMKPGSESAAEDSEKNFKARVLVVDDSVSMRRLLCKTLEGNPRIEVIGSLGDPHEAEAVIARDQPNVVTVDLQMPGLSGVELIQQLFPKFQLPMIVVSSLGVEEGSMVLDALEAGAVDYLQKPEKNRITEFKDVIQEKVLAAATATVSHARPDLLRQARGLQVGLDLERVIAIGASTGGTEAIKVVLASLPEQIPPILIAQHIPPVFSQAFAQRLNKMFSYATKEAEDGDVLRPNSIYIAPGGKQMRIKKVGSIYRIVLSQEENKHQHSPSANVLFESVAKVFGEKAIGVILTGMGDDGARGMRELKERGALTVGQDEGTCIVYGMPRAAVALGGVDVQKPLSQIGEQIMSWLKVRKSA